MQGRQNLELTIKFNFVVELKKYIITLGCVPFTVSYKILKYNLTIVQKLNSSVSGIRIDLLAAF